MRHKNKEDHAVALSKLDKTIKDKLRDKNNDYRVIAQSMQIKLHKLRLKDKEYYAIAHSKLDRTTKDKLRPKDSKHSGIAHSKLDKTTKR